MPETGSFLSVDAVESEPPYQYVRGNPVNWNDPLGMQGGPVDDPYTQECYSVNPGDIPLPGCAPPICLKLASRNASFVPHYCPLPVSFPSPERLDYVVVEVIELPCGTLPNKGELKNDALSNVLGGAGALLDAYEIVAIYSSQAPEAPAFIDVVLGLAGSAVAGETYISQQPHDELPNATILGQDFWVAFIDFGVAALAEKALPPLFGFLGATFANADGPVPISEVSGYAIGEGASKSIDTILTVFGLYNDISRMPVNNENGFLPPVPTYGGAGIMWEENFPQPVILIYEQCPPNDCD